MVKPPSFDSNGIKRGAWSEEEDNKLRTFVQRNGHPNWRLLPSSAGLARCGKSCRLRWVNYLQPGLVKGNFTKEEEDLIIRLHNQHGNKWSFIANKLPGRTDNDIKNHWHAHIKKRNHHVVDQIKKPNQKEETFTFDAPKNPEIITHSAINVGQDENMVAQAQGDIWTKACDQLPPFPEEEFPDFGLCYNDTSDSSHGGITYDHTQLKIDLPPLVGNEFFEFGVCPNDMSTFSDSSEGGITSQSDSNTVESDGSFWSEYAYGDDTIDMVLWQ